MNVMRAIGLALIVAGIVFLVTGVTATDSAVESLHETFTGRYTDKTMWYIAGGVAAVVAGGFLAMVRRPG